ncbi:MAG: hypothetical protein EBE86_013685 [Hormoscilla sp. GUM202]|nr:hypothetical protein [Hormoscilla sp. GUM202]
MSRASSAKKPGFFLQNTDISLLVSGETRFLTILDVLDLVLSKSEGLAGDRTNACPLSLDRDRP